MIDGATRLVVALVFSFLTSWNDVLFASVLTSPETRTVGAQLQAFSTSQKAGHYRSMVS